QLRGPDGPRPARGPEPAPRRSATHPGWRARAARLVGVRPDHGAGDLVAGVAGGLAQVVVLARVHDQHVPEDRAVAGELHPPVDAIEAGAPVVARGEVAEIAGVALRRVRPAVRIALGRVVVARRLARGAAV